MIAGKDPRFKILFFFAVISLLFPLLSGCGGLRSEFFRRETQYLYNQGSRAYRSGEFDKARAYFRQVVKLDPGYARAHAGLGNTALVRGDFDEAEQRYRRAMELEPGLEKKLKPLLTACLEKKARQPLEKCGLDLGKVLALLSGDNGKGLDKALSRDVPLDLLSRDTLSLTLKELVKLRDIILEKARSGTGSYRCRLFYGYFLFNSDGQERLAARVLEGVAEEAPVKERQKIYMMTGRLMEKMGENSRAAGAYLKAVDAGLPMSEAAPSLSRIYGVPAEEITAASSLAGDSEKEEEQGPVIGAAGLSSGVIGPACEPAGEDMGKGVSSRGPGIPHMGLKPSSYHKITD